MTLGGPPAGHDVLAALAGLALVLAYYLLVWFLVGRDPAKGVIIPLFAPPRGLSPAALRYVRRREVDHKSFAASVLNMAVKGYLKIEERQGQFTLRRTGKGDSELSAGERELAARLFSLLDWFVVNETFHAQIKAALADLEESIEAEYAEGYFVSNLGFFLPGVVISLLALHMVITATQAPVATGVTTLALMLLGGVCFVLAWGLTSRWRLTLRVHGVDRFWAAAGAAFFSLLWLPYLAQATLGAALACRSFLGKVSLPAAAVLAMILLANPLFYVLLKAPTLAGRRLLDQVEGFRLYLRVAEKERLGLIHPRELTPALFEKLLPYALALDVEHEWSEQFAGRFDVAGLAGEGYSPVWYDGRSWDSFRAFPGAASLFGGLSTPADERAFKA